MCVSRYSWTQLKGVYIHQNVQWNSESIIHFETQRPNLTSIKWYDHTPQVSSLSICEPVYHMQREISTSRLRQISQHSVISQMLMSGAEIIPMKSIFSPAVQSTLTDYFPAAENPCMQGRVSCETSTFTLCFFIACKWFQAAGIFSSRHCLLIKWACHSACSIVFLMHPLATKAYWLRLRLGNSS